MLCRWLTAVGDQLVWTSFLLRRRAHSDHHPTRRPKTWDTNRWRRNDISGKQAQQLAWRSLSAHSEWFIQPYTL